MAKDGTVRGGPRPGLGRKPKALADKVLTGDANDAYVIEYPEIDDLEGNEMPKVKEYLNEAQRDGSPFQAADIFRDTWKWLRERRCERFVNPQLLEQYSVATSRWVQCERAISKHGFLGKHPTTDQAIISPFVAVAEKYSKQMMAAWYQIYQIVKENCSVEYGGTNPHEDLMESLLKRKQG